MTRSEHLLLYFHDRCPQQHQPSTIICSSSAKIQPRRLAISPSSFASWSRTDTQPGEDYPSLAASPFAARPRTARKVMPFLTTAAAHHSSYDERHGRAYKCTAITNGCSYPFQAPILPASIGHGAPDSAVLQPSRRPMMLGTTMHSRPPERSQVALEIEQAAVATIEKDWCANFNSVCNVFVTNAHYTSTFVRARSVLRRRHEDRHRPQSSGGQ